VARRLVEAYPDGVWLVELATLSEGALVPKEVAEALGVPERPAQPLDDTLA
jgi:predicted ATPase